MEYGIGLRTIEKIIDDKDNIMNLDIQKNIFKLEIEIFSIHLFNYVYSIIEQTVTYYLIGVICSNFSNRG